MTKFDCRLYDQLLDHEFMLCFNGRVLCIYNKETKTCRQFQTYVLFEEYDKYVATLKTPEMLACPATEYKQKTSFGEFTLILTYDLISIFLDDGCTITQFKYR